MRCTVNGLYFHSSVTAWKWVLMLRVRPFSPFTAHHRWQCDMCQNVLQNRCNICWYKPILIWQPSSLNDCVKLFSNVQLFTAWQYYPEPDCCTEACWAVSVSVRGVGLPYWPATCDHLPINPDKRWQGHRQLFHPCRAHGMGWILIYPPRVQRKATVCRPALDWEKGSYLLTVFDTAQSSFVHSGVPNAAIVIANH